MKLFDSGDRTFELHLVSTGTASALFFALTGWTVIVQGAHFDPPMMQAFGVGFGAILTGGGLAALATGAGRRAQEGTTSP